MTDFQFLSILILIAQIGVASWQAYLAQKSKNKADKEDIEELTRLVESVKINFQKELSKANADLDILKDKKSKSYSQAQQAIIEFYSRYNSWVQTMLGIYLAGFNHNHIEDAEKLITTLEDLYRKTNIANSLMGLLVNENDLAACGHELIQSSLQMHNLITIKLDHLVSIFKREKANAAEFIENINLGDDEIEFRRIILDHNETQKKEIVTNFGDLRFAIYETLCNVERKFADLARDFLK